MVTHRRIPMIKKALATSLMTWLTLGWLLTLVVPVMAQTDRAASRRTISLGPSQGQGPTDPAELEAFLDELFTKDLDTYHIAGAAVAVVKDGKLFFAKGYYYNDVSYYFDVLRFLGL